MRAGECNVVPGAPFVSTYKIVCNSDEKGGNAQYCSDQACGNCVSQPFNNGDCIPTNPTYGSSSGKFNCESGSGSNSGAVATTLGAAVAAAAAAIVGYMAL